MINIDLHPTIRIIVRVIRSLTVAEGPIGVERALIAAGLVPAIIRLLRGDDDKVLTDALNALSSLFEINSVTND